MANITTKPRINKFDNLKGLAIILIVLGHMIFIYEFKSIFLLKKFIFTIHLPIFYFVAGYFSKIGPKEPMKAIKRLLIPYMLFCIIYKLFFFFILGKTSGMLFIDPEFGLWFLLSLFIMKLILPFLNKLKYPIITTLIIALIIGFIPFNLEYLAIARTCAFLPVFLVGFKYKDYKKIFDEKYPKLKKSLENPKIVLILLILAIIICIFIDTNVSLKAIELKTQYTFSSNIEAIKDVIDRFLIIMIGIIITLLLNNIMTNRKTFLTKLGINSMAIYLLHIYFMKVIREYLITHNTIITTNPIIYLIFVIISTAIIVLILSRDVVSKYLNKFTDGVFDLIIGIINKFKKNPIEI